MHTHSSGAHPNAEVLTAAYFDMGLPDAHGLLRAFGNNISFPDAPTYASTAFFAINMMKDPRMCGSVNLFGMESTDDNEAANHG